MGNGFIDDFYGYDFNTRSCEVRATGPMLSAAPDLPAWKVRELLEATAKDLEEKGKDTRTGAGLVRAPEAVKAATQAAN